MLKEILNVNLIELNVDVDNPDDAIRAGGRLLEKEGFIEHSYIDAMIENYRINGPYFVLTPRIAIPHAKVEAGAKKIGLSLISLSKPIEFGNKINDPVELVICLSATDHSSHIEALAELADILMDENKVEKILKSNDKEEVLEIL